MTIVILRRSQSRPIRKRTIKIGSALLTLKEELARIMTFHDHCDPLERKEKCLKIFIREDQRGRSKGNKRKIKT